jgi:hypothetical protein
VREGPQPPNSFWDDSLEPVYCDGEFRHVDQDQIKQLHGKGLIRWNFQRQEWDATVGVEKIDRFLA